MKTKDCNTNQINKDHKRFSPVDFMLVKFGLSTRLDWGPVDESKMGYHWKQVILERKVMRWLFKTEM